MTALIDLGTARALAEGAHGDPFSVLGLHKRGRHWVLTAFVPGADRLSVVTDKADRRRCRTPRFRGSSLCA